LFELTRHADHHYKASRKYQILKSYENSPHLPAGYPAMMLLSTIPPLWFKVMDPRIQSQRTRFFQFSFCVTRLAKMLVLREKSRYRQ
jgi:alkane 1-monooxygenase